MAAAAILDLRKLQIRDKSWISLYGKKKFLKFHENQSIGSKVTAVFRVPEFGWDFSIWGCFGAVSWGYHPLNIICN